MIYLSANMIVIQILYYWYLSMNNAYQYIQRLLTQLVEKDHLLLTLSQHPQMRP